MGLRKKIREYIRNIIKDELEQIFHKYGDVCVDHHMMSDSWAVIKVDSGPASCYLKFIDLGKADLKEIQQFLSQFERQHIDAAPQIECEFNRMYNDKSNFHPHLVGKQK